MRSTSLSLTPEDRDLLLTVGQDLGPVIRRKLSFAEKEHKRLVISLSKKEFDELETEIHEKSSGHQRQTCREVESVLRRLKDQFYADSNTRESPPTDRMDRDPDGYAAFQERIRQELDSWDGLNQEGLNRKMQDLADQYNRAPQTDLGGLSPVQMHHLLYSDYLSPESAIKLNGELPYEELANSEILLNARLFLRLLSESGGVKSTASGYLNQAFIRQLMEEVTWPSESWDDLLEMKKRINELDVFFIHILRILLTLSGYMRKYKGSFVITKTGKAVLDTTKAGEFYRALFYTYLTKFNQDYVVSYDAPYAIQQTYAYTLYRLAISEDKWIKRDDFPREIVYSPPGTNASKSNDWMEDRFHHLQILQQIVHPLARFGLLELRNKPDERWPKMIVLGAIRTTPLFSRFLSFNLEP